MRTTLHPLYKKLLLLALVFGPVVWLMFTDDGQRRTDTMMLWLFGEKEIRLDLQALDNHYSEGDINQVYADLDWQCQDRATAYGERLCVSRIGVFNGIPANYLTLFYRSDQLSAVKLRYRRHHHNALRQQLLQQLGQPELEERTNKNLTALDKINHWNMPHGQIIMKEALTESEEPALFWLSTDRGTAQSISP